MQFSIKDIENLTGIKSHTIRIWEQRYELVIPKRTTTNIRYYDDTDLKKLLNISLLNKRGVKISKIAKLNEQERERIILDFASTEDDPELLLHRLLTHMLNMDEVAFERIVNTHINMHGMEHAVIELIFPFLHHVGIMWQSGTVNPALEHFATHIIRTKLMVATDSVGYFNQPIHGQGRKKVLLFLPTGEMHEIGLLFANYLFRRHGHHTMYLGADLPPQDVMAVLDTYNPDLIFTSITISLHLKSLRSLISKLATNECKATVLMSGAILQNKKLELPQGFKPIKSLHDLQPFLV